MVVVLALRGVFMMVCVLAVGAVEMMRSLSMMMSTMIFQAFALQSAALKWVVIHALLHKLHHRFAVSFFLIIHLFKVCAQKVAQEVADSL